MQIVDVAPAEASGFASCTIRWECLVTTDAPGEAKSRFRAPAVRLTPHSVALATSRLDVGTCVGLELQLGGSTILVAHGRVASIAGGTGPRNPETAQVTLSGLGDVARSILLDAVRDGQGSER